MEQHTRVLVIGGGPAGAMAAILLAREGIEVTVYERDKFPRYHIGESLLTSAIPLLEFVGLGERVKQHGFIKKYGGFFRVKHGEPAGHIDFTKLSKYKHTYQVVRSEFDKLLLDYAGEVGARVFEETHVRAVEMDGDRPTAVSWRRGDGTEGRTSFDYCIDASGLSGILATKYLKNRHAQPAFANIAVGSYWRGFRPYRDQHGVEHKGAFSMEALTDGCGWTWAIPLHDGTLSVGTVLHRDEFTRRHERLGSAEAVYLDALKASPDVTGLIEGGEQVGEVHVWKDYSYIAERFAGTGYRLAGDAAGFVDPLFSSGVHMAFLGALSAAATLCSEVRGELTAAQAEHFHDLCLRQAYTRFMITLAGFYRQLRNQDNVVLTGVSSENFQLAFDLIQPLVSGNVDLSGAEMPAEVIDETIKYTNDMLLEVLEYDTGNDVARRMAPKFIEDSITDRFSAIDNMYIRLERGKLGVARCGILSSVAVATQRSLIKGMLSLKKSRERALS